MIVVDLTSLVSGSLNGPLFGVNVNKTLRMHTRPRLVLLLLLLLTSDAVALVFSSRSSRVSTRVA